MRPRKGGRKEGRKKVKGAKERRKEERQEGRQIFEEGKLTFHFDKQIGEREYCSQDRPLHIDQEHTPSLQ